MKARKLTRNSNNLGNIIRFLVYSTRHARIVSSTVFDITPRNNLHFVNFSFQNKTSVVPKA
jgi:hypothetical protein